MRKQSREMPSEWAYTILEQAPYVTVSMSDTNGMPYSIPLSLAKGENGSFYFHCAQEGKKLDILRRNPKVCLSAVAKCHPVVSPSDNGFTLEFKSAIAYGTAHEIIDHDEKVLALRAICERFLPQNMAHFDEAIQRSLDRTAVIRIDLDEKPTGKRKQYDKQGVEMKFGRME